MKERAAALLIEEAFPDFQVDIIEIAGEGDFCLGYTVNGHWLVRLARNAEASRALRVEAALMPRLAPSVNLPVPVIERIAPYRGDLLAAVHRKIEGVPLTRELYDSLPPGAQQQAVRDLAHFLRSLHDTSLAAAREAGVPSCDYPFCRTEDGITPGSAPEQYSAALDKLLAYPQIDRDTAHFCAGVVRALLRQERDDPAAPAPVHGDLSAEHVLFNVRRERITGVIDFTDVILTDPALDLMYLYSAYGDAFLGELLRHYAPDRSEPLAGRVRLLHRWYAVLRLLWPLEHGYPEAVERRLAELRALVDEGL
ncbi:MAG TPA: phosphotransferase [Chloroflexia bacterium]|nr:phosphotransferase [Chloroflexia bacterium]